MARFALDAPLAAIPCVVDMIDADSAKWATLSRAARVPLKWIYAREATLLGRFEARAMRAVFATLVVNDREQALLRALAPDSRIEVLENGVDLQTFAPPGPPAPSSTVVFCGVMNYQPNVEGAVWLTRQVWPRVRAARPDARLQLVGASPSAEVSALASSDTGVVVTGSVEDVKPYLWGAAVAAAPLIVARGIQNKVLEAIAAGLPCVVTKAVAEGLPAAVTPACRTAATAEEFAAAILAALAHDPAARRAAAGRADLGALNWSARLQRLMPLLEQAAATRMRS
jgi:sugar transferase (PEP-CTERM/EpsH1 system associated)